MASQSHRRRSGGGSLCPPSALSRNAPAVTVSPACVYHFVTNRIHRLTHSTEKKAVDEFPSAALCTFCEQQFMQVNYWRSHRLIKGPQSASFRYHRCPQPCRQRVHVRQQRAVRNNPSGFRCVHFQDSPPPDQVALDGPASVQALPPHRKRQRFGRGQ